MSTAVRGDTIRTGLVIEHLERITNSVNGNPRFRVHFTDGTAARTMSDASPGLENPEYRGVPLTVTFTAHGKIRRAVPEPPDPGIIGEPAWRACHADVYRAANGLEG